MVKAAVFTGPDQVEIREFPKPEIAKDCALLRVTDCGVCGTDPHIYSGHLSVPTPTVLGHEFSGIIEEMGPDFPHQDAYGQPLAEGDPITIGTSLACGTCYYCRHMPHRSNLCQTVDIYGITMTCETAPYLFGGYSEYVYLYPNTWTFKVPDGLSLELAALADPMACATRTLERAYQPGLPWAGEGVGIGQQQRDQSLRRDRQPHEVQGASDARLLDEVDQGVEPMVRIARVLAPAPHAIAAQVIEGPAQEGLAVGVERPVARHALAGVGELGRGDRHV